MSTKMQQFIEKVSANIKDYLTKEFEKYERRSAAQERRSSVDQAAREGRDVQCRSWYLMGDDWTDCYNPGPEAEPDLDWDRFEFRIKRKISRFLYLAAALIEQLPDAELPKMVTGRTFTIADQIKSANGRIPRKKNGKQKRHSGSGAANK
jgi:hypothetical protein